MTEFCSGDASPYPKPTSLTGFVYQKLLLTLRVAGGTSVEQKKLSIVTVSEAIQKQKAQVSKL